MILSDSLWLYEYGFATEQNWVMPPIYVGIQKRPTFL